jgi:hypothetical protein
MKGVTYGTDVDAGEGGLLVHWTEEEQGGGWQSRGERKNIRPPLFLNEFRVFFQDWSAQRFLMVTKKEKRREASQNGNSRVIVELMYFYDFSRRARFPARRSDGR